jgi:uncharacterized integral membrane protein (TIGR00697 family)
MYTCLAITYAVALVLSNLIASKLITVFGFVLPAAVIIYPLVYIISDIMTEVYGMRMSMLSIKMNAFMNIMMVIVFYVTLQLPWPSFWGGQEAMVSVFGSTPRIVLASLLGYYFGDWANSMVISFMKVKMKGKMFAVRAIGSTLVGQAVDTGLFILIAFAGIVPTNVLIQMIIAQYIVKCGYEAICVPLTTAIVGWWKKKEEIDVFDEEEKFATLYKPV